MRRATGSIDSGNLSEYDERLLSPKRLFYAVLLWAWFAAVMDVSLPLGGLVRHYRRPYAARATY